MKRRTLLLCACSGWPWAATAQAWPARTVRVIASHAAGTSSDDVLRVLAERLSDQLDVPVVVDYRAGAGGVLAMELLARATPDGHTLCFSTLGPLTLLPHLGLTSYDPLRDIVPVASVMLTPVLVVGTPALHARSLADVIATARAWPGRLRWATSGHGSSGHLVLAQVSRASGVDITHIPYRGDGRPISDALGGEFELLSTSVGSVQLHHIQARRFTPLAVSAPSRLPVLPQVPTLAELGFAQANIASLFGMFAPGGTPQTVVQRLNAELNQALAQAEIRQRVIALNHVPTGGSAAALSEQIAREWETNRRVLEHNADTPR